MGTLANPSNVSNQMFLSYALVEWSVVAYLAADAYVFVHIKLGSWPPSLYHDRLSHEARQVPTRAAAQPSLVVRRPFAIYSGAINTGSAARSRAGFLLPTLSATS